MSVSTRGRVRRPPPKKTKALTQWDEELARQAEEAAKREANTGGDEQFFSLAGGILSWQEAPLPNNEVAVILLGSLFENIYYEVAYNPDDPAPPTCFALAEEDDDLAPHPNVIEVGQSQTNSNCKECEHNKWGSADTGRGKACRNTRRLALLPAGKFDSDGQFELFEDPAHYEKEMVGYLRLPVTSVAGYASYVKQLSGTLLRPPHGVVTSLRVVPSAKKQFEVVFEVLQKVPDELLGAVMARRKKIEAVMDFPYPLDFDDEPPAPKAKRAVRRGGRRKYSQTRR